MATTADYYLQYVEALDAIAADVTDWESEFVESMLKNRPQIMTEKQQAVICRMAEKYLGEVI